MGKTSRTNTILNRTALKRYALEASKAIRAAKFSRVGQTFIDRCEARTDAAIRAIYRGDLGPITPILSEEGVKFITPYGKVKASEQMELLARDVIFSEVRSHPSLGKTLR